MREHGASTFEGAEGRLLVADVDASTRDALQGMLRRGGFVFDVARDGSGDTDDEMESVRLVMVVVVVVRRFLGAEEGEGEEERRDGCWWRREVDSRSPVLRSSGCCCWWRWCWCCWCCCRWCRWWLHIKEDK